MNNSNRIRLTWISFFSYGITGALVIITGVILGNIADYFKLPISSMSNTFTFLNLGILLAIFLNTWLMEIISIGYQLSFGFLLILLATLSIMITHSLLVFSLSIFILGIVSGITMSIGTYLITYLYQGRIRSSYLLLADSFFSIAGILFPMLAGILLANNIIWYWIYLCISMVYVAIFVLTLKSTFPVLNKKYTKVENLENLFLSKGKWGFGIILLAIAALCYILGQLSFISWMPEYAISRFEINIQQASKLVSNFWITYMVGMWIFSGLLRFFDLQRTVTVLSAVSAVIIYLIINAKNVIQLSYFMLGLGFISSAIYTIIITLGSQQTRISSPRIINFILTCGTIGTTLTFIITGPIVANFGIKAALQISNILYMTVSILCLLFRFVQRVPSKCADN